MMKKLPLALALALALGCAPAAARSGPVFSDLTPVWSWAAPAIEEMAEAGLFQGTALCSDGTALFSPAQSMTRAEFLTVVLKHSFPEDFAAAMSGPADLWWEPVARLAQEKLDYTSPAMEAPMPRQEMALVVITAARQTNRFLHYDISPELIPDFDRVEEACRPAVLAAYRNGILSGVDEAGTFDPAGLLTRAEAALVLQKLTQLQPAW